MALKGSLSWGTVYKSVGVDGIRKAHSGPSPELLTELKFDAPIKTVSEANGRYGRQHWAVKRERRIAQQKEMDVMLLNALEGRKIQFPCTVKLTRVGPKLMDGDNLQSAFKAIRDAIAARLGIDDGDKRIKFEYDQIAIGFREYNVQVEITSQNGKES